MKTKPQLLTEFMTGLNEMESAASCIIHQHQDLRWGFIRKIIEEIKDRVTQEAVAPLTRGGHTRVKKRPTQVAMS